MIAIYYKKYKNSNNFRIRFVIDLCEYDIHEFIMSLYH